VSWPGRGRPAGKLAHPVGNNPRCPQTHPPGPGFHFLQAGIYLQQEIQPGCDKAVAQNLLLCAVSQVADLVKAHVKHRIPSRYTAANCGKEWLMCGGAHSETQAAGLAQVDGLRIIPAPVGQYGGNKFCRVVRLHQADRQATSAYEAAWALGKPYPAKAAIISQMRAPVSGGTALRSWRPRR